MIKFVMCLTRHPDLSRDEFKTYWLDKHGPFFMKNADVLGAIRYVQSHTLDSPLNNGLRKSRGMLAEFDGVAEVWFDSEEALIEGMNSTEGQRLAGALLEDESKFIDHSKSAAFIVEEHEL
ncbi:MAG: EthD domain-containing protein [Planctomycetales bacterium]|nr:EthD domain-containing protein [Planctomycetales bacterium]